MTEHTTLTVTVIALSLLKLVTIALGAAFVAASWRAYRATGRSTFFTLTGGVGLLTLAAVAEGLAFQGLRLSLDQAHVIEAVFTLLGFAVLVYALYGPDKREGAAPVTAEPADDAETTPPLSAE